MHLGANTTQPTSADRLAPLFDKLDALNKEWRDLMVTPNGRLRRSHTVAQKAMIDTIRAETDALHDQITQIVKDA